MEFVAREDLLMSHQTGATFLALSAQMVVLIPVIRLRIAIHVAYM